MSKFQNNSMSFILTKLLGQCEKHQKVKMSKDFYVIQKYKIVGGVLNSSKSENDKVSK
uniref:Uncharacterized protein n=1 Tax=Arundo donax TaxID=35708 RepID=A0A0A9E833_ARUDO